MGGTCSRSIGYMLKQRALAFLCALLMLLGLCSFASAEGATSTLPIKVEIVLSKAEFIAPEDITVTIRITNVTDETLAGPVSVQYPNGHTIDEFGTPTLEAGASQSWTGTWTVTQSELDNGKLSFGVRYPIKDENGVVSNARSSFAKRITQVQAEPEVEIERTITPGTARKGQEVSVVYEIRNVGSVDLTNVRIKESSAVSSSTVTVGDIPAGEKKTHAFTVTMGTKDLTSNATITYTAAGKTHTEKVGNATLKYGNVNLNATLTADKKGGNPGDTVTFTLTLKNTGKKDITGITITDPTLGTLFTDLTVAAGKTVTQTTALTLTQSGEYQFTARGTQGNTTIETATGRLSLVCLDPSLAPSLTVEAVPSSDVVYKLPAVLRFTVTVTNVGSAEAKNVSVSSSGVTLYTFSSIGAGESATFMRDVEVQMTGKFRFDASYKNELDETSTFEGNVIQISQAAPTSVPTSVPVTTPKPFVPEELPTTDNLPASVAQFQDLLTYLYYFFAVLAVISALLLAVSIYGHFTAKRKAANGQDQFDISERRDYTEEVAEQDRIIIGGDEDDAPDEPAEPVSSFSTPEGDAQEFYTADDMEDDGDAMEDAKAEIYGRKQK